MKKKKKKKKKKGERNEDSEEKKKEDNTVMTSLPQDTPNIVIPGTKITQRRKKLSIDDLKPNMEIEIDFSINGIHFYKNKCNIIFGANNIKVFNNTCQIMENLFY